MACGLGRGDCPVRKCRHHNNEPHGKWRSSSGPQWVVASEMPVDTGWDMTVKLTVQKLEMPHLSSIPSSLALDTILSSSCSPELLESKGLCHFNTFECKQHIYPDALRKVASVNICAMSGCCLQPLDTHSSKPNISTAQLQIQTRSLLLPSHRYRLVT